jgi:hypothetical protein
VVALDRLRSWPVARLDGQWTPSHRWVLIQTEPAGAVDWRNRHTCIGGLTERKGARLLSDGRGQPRQRSIRCPSAMEGMPRWLGAPCFENSDTVLPWGFDTSTFRSGAVVQREHAGPSPRRMSDRNRPASPSRHRIKAVRRVLSPEAGGRYPVAVRGIPIGLPMQCGVAQRKSGWPLTTVVGGSMPSSAALAP